MVNMTPPKVTMKSTKKKNKFKDLMADLIINRQAEKPCHPDDPKMHQWVRGLGGGKFDKVPKI